MRTKLEKLIAAYEAERANLTAEMEECVADMDYGKAHLFFKSLSKVSQHLQTLHNIQDNGYDEKERLAHSIKFLEERITSGEEYMRRYLAERVAQEKEKLDELNQTSALKATAGHTVFDLLGKLLAGELASFTLILRDSARLYCRVKAVRRTLFLTVPEIRRHRVNYTLRKSHIRKLQSLGFRPYDNKDKLILFTPYSTWEDINTVQRVLARITFEVFYFKDLAGETYIKYYP